MLSTEYRVPSTEYRVRGFTIVELIVAMGLLVGLMTMVGMIFSVATQTASQGQASMNVYGLLRTARQVITEDLAAFDPQDGALALYGWEQLAYATAGERDSGLAVNNDRVPNGDPELDYRPPFPYHRADMMMLITKRKAAPFAVNQPDAIGTGQIVVYGHADQGEIVTNGKADISKHTWDPNVIRRIEAKSGSGVIGSLGIKVGNAASSMTASQWHLARRAVTFTSLTASQQGWNGFMLLPVTPTYDLHPILRERIATAGAGSNGDGAPGSDAFERMKIDPMLDAWAANLLEGIPDDWYYPSGSSPDKRTLLDVDPPPGQQGRLAYYFLPGCVDFKVEVTWDTGEMIWNSNTTVPGQPPTHWFTIPSGTRIEWVRGQAVGLQDSESPTQNAYNASWRDVIFFDLGDGTGAYSKLKDETLAPNPTDPPFPTAIRITLRVMDQNESLFEPQFNSDTGEMISEGAIREVIVHKF